MQKIYYDTIKDIKLKEISKYDQWYYYPTEQVRCGFMGMDFNKNGIQDEEDLIIMDELENNHQTNASTTVSVIVVVIVAIVMCWIIRG